MKSPTSKLANSLLAGLKGIEMGASAHNPFGLDTLNVDWTDSLNTSWKQEELQHCGETAKVDVVADGADLPFENSQWDFVVSSHCLEHNWDTIGALKEWLRVVKVGGYVFTIFPHPERTFDKGRPRTKLSELILRHSGTIPHPNMVGLVATVHTWVLFHHTVWHLEDALECVKYIGGCEVVTAEEFDDKVGNGFTFVIKKTDPNAGARTRIVQGGPAMNDAVIHYPQYSSGNYLCFWCPGCECVHTIPFINAPPPAPEKLWAYDGNRYAPTISPSLRVMDFDGESSRCHVVITKGVLNYCVDCKHKLAGQAVPMTPWEGRPKK